MLGVCSAVMPRRESTSAARAVPPLRIRFAGPAGDAPRLLLAHGAGAGMDSEFMSAVARGLGALGVRVARFEFEYMARRRTGVRPPPDRLPRLFARFRAAAERVGPLDQLVIGGKSMGGRIASMLADELGVKGVTHSARAKRSQAMRSRAAFAWSGSRMAIMICSRGDAAASIRRQHASSCSWRRRVLSVVCDEVWLVGDPELTC